VIKRLAFPSSLLWTYALLLVLFFEIQRLGMLVRHWNYFTTGIPAGTLLAAFLYGLRLDHVVASYLLLPPACLALVLALAGVAAATIARWMVGMMRALVVGVALLAWGELEFFRYFRDRYTTVAVEYLDAPWIVWHTIWAEYHPLQVAAIALATWWLFRRALHTTSQALVVPASRWTMAGGIVLSIALSLLAVTGGVGRNVMKPHWGRAYFSRHTPANQLALNGLFTLIADRELSLDAEWGGANRYYPDDEALERVRQVLRGSNERYVDSAGSPLLRAAEPSTPRLLRSERPHVVLLILESFSGQAVGALGGPIGSTPEFDRLARDGVLFTRYFSQGNRTSRALFALLTGLPAPPGPKVLKTATGRRPFVTLASLLRERGYRTRFVYGGSLAFENLAGFMWHNGFDEVIGLEDFPDGKSWEWRTKWGVPDHLVLERVHELLRADSGPATLTVVLTLSNHPPYELPDEAPRPFAGRLAKQRNAVHYADWSLGRFFARARTSSYFDRTLFVVVGDHGQFYEDLPATPVAYFWVPCLFYGPRVLAVPPRRVAHVMGHTDVAPTLLGLLGERFHHAFWGRDVFERPIRPPSLLTAQASVVYLIEDAQILQDTPTGATTLYAYDRPDRWTPVVQPPADHPLVVKERSLRQVLWRLTSRPSQR
jgi:phosphoglycerol transferase MdoB-like AlkP superfamily enzyme